MAYANKVFCPTSDSNNLKEHYYQTINSFVSIYCHRILNTHNLILRQGKKAFCHLNINPISFQRISLRETLQFRDAVLFSNKHPYFNNNVAKNITHSYSYTHIIYYYYYDSMGPPSTKCWYSCTAAFTRLTATDSTNSST